jgi:hypothetical protein
MEIEVIVLSYEFPVVAVTNDHKLDDFKQIYSASRRPKSFSGG